MGKAFLIGLFLVFPAIILWGVSDKFRISCIVIVVITILYGLYKGCSEELEKRQADCRKRGIRYEDYRGPNKPGRER